MSRLGTSRKGETSQAHADFARNLAQWIFLLLIVELADRLCSASIVGLTVKLLTCFSDGVESNFPFFLWGRAHQLTNRIEYYFKLGIEFIFKRFEFSCQAGLGRKKLAQSNEGPHDLDIDSHRARTAQIHLRAWQRFVR